MDFESGKMELWKEISQKLSTYKIPLKSSSTSSSKDSTSITKNDGNPQFQPPTFTNDTIKETFLSPLFNCELSNELVLQEYSRQQNFAGFPTKQMENDNFNRKRKYTAAEKPMFYGRDPTYPPELNDLIEPLYCNLCKAQLNSIKSARLHYESKVHDKRILNWLNEWSNRNGEPVPKVKRLVKDGPVGPDAFHCEACDLPLTSIQHASQHYNGKRHKMVVSGRVDPSGSGYYNSEGKWIRQNTKPLKDSSTRFGIGESFIKVDEMQEPPQPQDPSKYCEICNISVTSSHQMEMHLSGTKHAKKLKQLGQPPSIPPRIGETILDCITSTPNNDISIYRTPSGNYYCKQCNITISDVGTFQQHLGSKKHIKNLKATKSIEKEKHNGSSG